MDRSLVFQKFILETSFDSSVEWSDPLSYLWRVITYLFDYFVNYLSIELLIHLHDKAWIMNDLI